MCKEYKDVIEFNNRVIGLTCKDFLSKERMAWFKQVINEELGEFEVANNNYIEAKGSQDEYMANCCRADMIDAIIDTLYFAYGRLYELGVFPEDFAKMWSMVHAANMKKKKGNKGRGSDLDAIKPEGWEAPEKKFFTSALPVEDYQADKIISEDYHDAHNITKEEKPIVYRQAINAKLDTSLKVMPVKEHSDIHTLDTTTRPGMQYVCDLETIAAMPKAFIDATQLCMKKSQDYNNGTNKPASRKEYFPFGLLSYAQMLHTKTQRLNSLAQQTKKPNNESIRDTLLDLINYAGFAAEAIDKGEI